MYLSILKGGREEYVDMSRSKNSAKVKFSASLRRREQGRNNNLRRKIRPCQVQKNVGFLVVWKLDS